MSESERVETTVKTSHVDDGNGSMNGNGDGESDRDSEAEEKGYFPKPLTDDSSGVSDNSDVCCEFRRKTVTVDSQPSDGLKVNNNKNVVPSEVPGWDYLPECPPAVVVAPMEMSDYIVGDWVRWEGDTNSPPKLAFEVLEIKGEVVY